MSKAKITIDGPSFYAKIGRFYEKWSESDEFETFIFILGKVVDQDSQGQKKNSNAALVADELLILWDNHRLDQKANCSVYIIAEK